MTRGQQAVAAMLFVAVLVLGGWSWSQDSSPSDLDAGPNKPSQTDAGQAEPTDGERKSDGGAGAPGTTTPGTDSTPPPIASESPVTDQAPSVSEPPRRQGIITNLTIFVLAVFLGIEVISKVPPTLHTPLMSGSNAISGIALVGAVIVASSGSVTRRMRIGSTSRICLERIFVRLANVLAPPSICSAPTSTS